MHSSSDYLTDVAMNRVYQSVPGGRRFTEDFVVFGYNNNITNSAFSFIGGGARNFLTSPDKVRIKAGGDVADTAGGAGAQEVYIQGIKADLTEGFELLTTAGASASAESVADYWRINRVFVTKVGTYEGKNVGDMVIESAGGIALSYIKADVSVAQDAIYSVENGHAGLFFNAIVSTESNKPVSFNFWFREQLNVSSGGVYAPAVLARRIGGVEGFRRISFGIRPKIRGLTDFWVEAKLDSGTSAVVSVIFDLVKEPNGGAGA